jgi:hypothetical protein
LQQNILCNKPRDPVPSQFQYYVLPKKILKIRKQEEKWENLKFICLWQPDILILDYDSLAPLLSKK